MSDDSPERQRAAAREQLRIYDALAVALADPRRLAVIVSEASDRLRAVVAE